MSDSGASYWVSRNKVDRKHLILVILRFVCLDRRSCYYAQRMLEAFKLFVDHMLSNSQRMVNRILFYASASAFNPYLFW
jgi:hypothetical protein